MWRRRKSRRGGREGAPHTTISPPYVEIIPSCTTNIIIVIYAVHSSIFISISVSISITVIVVISVFLTISVIITISVNSSSLTGFFKINGFTRVLVIFIISVITIRRIWLIYWAIRSPIQTIPCTIRFAFLALLVVVVIVCAVMIVLRMVVFAIPFIGWFSIFIEIVVGSVT